MASSWLGAIPTTLTLQVNYGTGESSLITVSRCLCNHTIRDKCKQCGEEWACNLVVTAGTQNYTCLVSTVLLSRKGTVASSGSHLALWIPHLQGSRGHKNEESQCGGHTSYLAHSECSINAGGMNKWRKEWWAVNSANSLLFIHPTHPTDHPKQGQNFHYLGIGWSHFRPLIWLEWHLSNTEMV